MPKQILNNLAEEVHNVFQLRKATFYTPGHSENKKKTCHSAKFVSRIDYMRKKLVESKGLHIAVKSGLDSSRNSTENQGKNVLAFV